LLVPTALTTDATQAGPESLPLPAWSESAQSGTTHDTAGRRFAPASLRISFSGGDDVLTPIFSAPYAFELHRNSRPNIVAHAAYHRRVVFPRHSSVVEGIGHRSELVEARELPDGFEIDGCQQDRRGWLPARRHPQGGRSGKSSLNRDGSRLAVPAIEIEVRRKTPTPLRSETCDGRGLTARQVQYGSTDFR